MQYETIEENAGILARIFLESSPPHIFLGDTDHFNIVTTMSCVSHPSVLAALREQGKTTLGVEMSPSVAEKFLKGAREQNFFEDHPHEECVFNAQRVEEEDPEYTKQIAFELLVSQCDKFDIRIEGVDTHQENITPEEYDATYELGIEQFTLMQKIQASLGKRATNLGWFTNKDLKTVWRDVVNSTDPDNFPEHKKIVDLASMMIALTYLERWKKYSKTVEKPRMQYDPKTAALIKSKAGTGGSFTVFGDGHIGIPQALGEDTLHISFCPADNTLLHLSKIGDMVQNRVPNFYLDAPDNRLIEGHQAQQEALAMISAHFSLDAFR